MLKRLFSILLLAVATAASAQFGVGGVGRPAAVPPDTVMPASKIYVNLATISARRFNYSTQRSVILCTGVYDSGSPACTLKSGTQVPNRYTTGLGVNNSGSFRVACSFSHSSFDDPIVWPGQAGRTHLHQFFGNASTRSATDLINMATSGNSTCHGGTLNRSGYWAPTLIYHRPGNGRDGEVTVAEKANFYYKIATGYASDTGGFGGTPAQWAPAGFRMITGNPTGTTSQASLGSGFVFDCFSGATATTATPQGSFPGYRFDHIPTTAEATAIGGCNFIQFNVPFPDCWNGVDLDDATLHRAHIAYSGPTTGCTTTVTKYDGTSSSGANFPILFPSISLNILLPVATADLDYMRLSSDPSRTQSIANGCLVTTNYCAGYTLHSDWVNGWAQSTNINGWGMSVTQAIMLECYMIANPLPTQHSDCHDHLLGSPLADNNWWSLY